MAVPAIIVVAWKASSVYIFWIGIHYLTAHIYPYFCAELSVLGAFSSPFVAMAPHCKALLWAQQTSVMAIENMWVVFGTWMCSYLVPSQFISSS
jgi:hypothetical protein